MRHRRLEADDVGPRRCERLRRLGAEARRDDRVERTVGDHNRDAGESLILPPAFEHLRSQVEQVLTPLPDPRAAWKG